MVEKGYRFYKFKTNKKLEKMGSNFKHMYCVIMGFKG